MHFATLIFTVLTILTSTIFAAPAIVNGTLEPRAPAPAPWGISAAGWTHNGVATYYYQKGNAGSCGWWKADSDFLVAISGVTGNQHCGRTVSITNRGGGQQNYGVGNTITALIADTCPANECDMDHIDLSVGAFAALTGGPLDPPGRINVEWTLN